MFEETFQNFTINFNALNPKVTFSGGDVLSGQVLFDLTKEAKIQSIMMSMKGKASVLWHEQNRGPATGRRGGVGRNRRRQGAARGRRRTYSADLDFFNLSHIVMQANDASGHTVLPPGKHVFPFTCQLPQGDFPPSFNGTYGKIRYSMVVAIHRPWHLAKEFDTEVQFASRTDANHPHLRMPLTGSNAKTLCCLWCTSGPVSLNAQVERKGFSPGETVKIIAEIGNASSRTVTPHVKLVMEQICYTSGRAKRKYVSSVKSSKDGQSIGPNTTDVHSEIMLHIPENAALTIANCQIIDVQYYVMLSLKISRSSDLEVKFPIALCGIPFNPNQAPTTVQPQSQHTGQYPNQQPGPYSNQQAAPYQNPPPGQYQNPPPGPYQNPPPGPYANQPPGPYANQPPGQYQNPPPGPYPNQPPGPYPNQPPGPYANQPPGPYPNQTPVPYGNPAPGPYPGQQPGQPPNQYAAPNLAQNPGLYPPAGFQG
ncbi:arrestin domain-containing protein 3-like [Alosa pseudoharengus]|uniref:arrestin domain-containing protein 3-like n=1 Tax=Alosa pseudoharengus TaxID=34774 RepID=UPI003F8ABB09